MLRLWSAQLDGRTSHVDARIRDVLGPRAASTPGLLAFYPARRGTDTDAGRIIATVWDSESAMDAAADGLPALASDLFPGHDEVLPVAISEMRPPAADGEPAILRVFRGVVREGHLASYVDAAQRGTQDDIAAGAGPVALFLAVAGPERFVTVSAWSSWRTLEIATGGNIHQPIATRNADLLVSGSVTHYEILPGALSGPPRVPTAAG